MSMKTLQKNKETYRYKEVAEILSIEPKEVKELIINGKLEAIDIRINPNPISIDIRHLRVLKTSLKKYLKEITRE